MGQIAVLLTPTRDVVDAICEAILRRHGPGFDIIMAPLLIAAAIAARVGRILHPARD